jgi:hypothetical protein
MGMTTDSNSNLKTRTFIDYAASQNILLKSNKRSQYQAHDIKENNTSSKKQLLFNRVINIVNRVRRLTPSLLEQVVGIESTFIRDHGPAI